MTKRPNTALQRTAALAFSYRSAGERSTGSVTACAPAMKPGTCRAFASRRSAHTRASGRRSLSFRSLGVATRLVFNEAFSPVSHSFMPSLFHPVVAPRRGSRLPARHRLSPLAVHS